MGVIELLRISLPPPPPKGVELLVFLKARWFLYLKNSLFLKTETPQGVNV
jgi:hypothetical protein